MKRITVACALMLLTWQWANAASDNPKWQPCIEMLDKAPAQSELDCFRQAAQEAKQSAEKQKSLLPSRAPWLAQEWAPNNDPLNVYKQNYVLVYSQTNPTNDTPTSPNPQNQATNTSPLDNRSLKFQFSIKHDLADFDRYGSLWFGYTQLSFWQFYDAARSRPFRENNYEPEFIYSIRPNDLIAPTGIFPSVINFGLVHQSNGQSNPMSRSWNRMYVQTGTEHNYGSDHRLVVLLRLWHRIDEDALTDDNPDIAHYMGHGDIELRATRKIAAGRQPSSPGSAQCNLTFPHRGQRGDC
jgi:phospholipase A1